MTNRERFRETMRHGTPDRLPGFDEGIAGAEFADRLGKQARRFGVEILQAQDVVDISPDGQYLTGSIIEVTALITALISRGST